MAETFEVGKLIDIDGKTGVEVRKIFCPVHAEDEVLPVTRIWQPNLGDLYRVIEKYPDLPTLAGLVEDFRGRKRSKLVCGKGGNELRKLGVRTYRFYETLIRNAEKRAQEERSAAESIASRLGTKKVAEIEEAVTEESETESKPRTRKSREPYRPQGDDEKGKGRKPRESKGRRGGKGQLAREIQRAFEEE